MITKNNYHTQIKSLPLSQFGDGVKRDIQDGIRFIEKLETDGADWKNAPVDSPIGKVVESFLALINKAVKVYSPKPVPAPSLEGTPTRSAKPGPKQRPYKWETAFFKTYLSLHNTNCTRAKIGLLIDRLQAGIREKRMKLAHLYGPDFMYMQTRLVDLYNDMEPGETRKVQVDAQTRSDFQKVVSWKGRIPAEILLEKFLRLNKKGFRGKALSDLKQAFKTGGQKGRFKGRFEKICKRTSSILNRSNVKVTPKDIQQVEKALGLIVSSRGLSGIEFNIQPGKLKEYRTDQLPDNSHLQLPFTGKWKDLFNLPTKGFSAMVYGKPKQGKSTFVLDFCGYLAKNQFGNVLWIELEEDLNTTFKEKVDRLTVGHENFRAWPEIPDDMSAYNFVVINSVSEGKITPDEIRSLKKKYPQTSFVFIYHTRKDGEFAGGQEHAHLVDMLIEVKDGKAVANGRFGRGEAQIRFTSQDNADQNGDLEIDPQIKLVA